MNFIIFGSPGSGKGTYSSRIAPQFGIVRISTGDIFREQIKLNTSLGKIVEPYVSKGVLVPDDIVIDVFAKRINEPDCKNGYFLDGYPRTMHQVEFLNKVAEIAVIINLTVPEWIIIERLSTRRICRKCGEIFNIKHVKPKKEGICDSCGGNLYQREDDKPEVIKTRLEYYKKWSEPVIAYYKKTKIPMIEIECNSPDIPPETMIEKILEELKDFGLKF